MTNTPKKQELIVHQYKELPFSQRKSDCYYNATEMCIAWDKLFNDYFRLKRTKKFLKSLSVNTGIPVLDLVLSKIGGKHDGSYIHIKFGLETHFFRGGRKDRLSLG